MQKHISSLLILFFIPFSLTGQEDKSRQPLFGIKYTPTSLMNPNTATWMFGGEIWINEKWYAQLDYGIRSNRFEKTTRNKGKENWEYEKIKLGLRTKLVGNQGFMMCIGGDFFMIPQSYTDKNGTSPFDHRVYVRYKTADIKKNAWGAMGSLAFRWALYNNFFVEIYGGLGIKFMNVEHDVDWETATLASGYAPSFNLFNIADYDKTPGQKKMPYIDLGFKIGYLFYKK